MKNWYQSIECGQIDVFGLGVLNGDDIAAHCCTRFVWFRLKFVMNVGFLYSNIGFEFS